MAAVSSSSLSPAPSASASPSSSLAAPWPRAIGKQASPAGQLHARLSRQRLAANARDAYYNAPRTTGRLLRHTQVGAAWGACAARALAAPITATLDALLGTGQLHRTVRGHSDDVRVHSEAHPLSSGLLLRMAWAAGESVGCGGAAATLAWGPLEGARLVTAALKGGVTGLGLAVGALLGLAAGGLTELLEHTSLERLRPWRSLRDAVRNDIRAHRLRQAERSAAACLPVRAGPFPEPVARAFVHVFGPNGVRRDELVAKYQPLLPNAHWVAQAQDFPASAEGPEGLVYALCAYDHRGKLIATLQRTAVKHADESIDLHSANVYVAPRYRGRAFSARCEAVEAEWLRTCSQHPRTRLSLAAGYMRHPLAAEDVAQEHSGYYVHAQHGYQFADAAGLTPIELSGLTRQYPARAPGEPEDSDRSDRTLMTERFTQWLKARQDWLTVRDAPASAQDYAALRAEVAQCTHPWEFAQVGLAMRASFNGKPVAAAFMTDRAEAHWRGVRFVNPAEEGPQVAIRAQSDAAYKNSTDAEIVRSDRREATRAGNLAQQLNHVSWKERLAGYKALRRDGDRGWEAALQARAERCAPLERAKLDEALAAIGGQRVVPGLSERAARPTLAPHQAQFLLEQRDAAVQQL